MIIIPLRCQKKDETPKEWALLELNGEVIPPKVKTVVDSNYISCLQDEQIELGSIKFNEEGTPLLTVGTHELKGGEKKLNQPFIVVRKRKRPYPPPSDSNNENQDIDSKIKEKRAKCYSHDEYEITGIVTKKILFDNYPKTIMH